MGTLAGLGICEALARVLYTAPWHERLVDEQGRNERRPYDRNAYGLRGPIPSVPKAPGHRRILALGDSFTFGMGVRDREAIFPERLERAINRDLGLPGIERVDVINGGIPASLTKDWLDLWHRVGDRLDPDVVLLVFFLRDGTTMGSIPGFFGRIRREITRRNRRSSLYQRSFLYRLLRDHVDQATITTAYTRRFLQAYVGSPEQTREWHAAQRNLLELRRQAEERSAVVGLVIFPVLVELNEDNPFGVICDEIEAFANDSGMPVHNLLPDYAGRYGPDLWVSAFDQHPNELAHAIAADSLYPFVMDLLEKSEAIRAPGGGDDRPGADAAVLTPGRTTETS